MTEFQDEMKKQEVGLTTEPEYWAYVDHITLATTAELAPFVLTKLKETLERHDMELRSDKCTAYCPKITETGKKDLEPTKGRLQHARVLANKIRQMCEADLDCRRLAPA